MDDGSYYFSTNLDNDTELLLAPLTDDTAIAAGLDPDQSGGYYLYEQCSTNITIIARVDTDEAAFVLGRMLKMV